MSKLLGVIIIFSVGIVLLALAEKAPTPEIAEVPTAYDDRMLALDRAAVDEAYRHQVGLLFASWMKDSTGQPARSIRGVRQMRRAYVAAMDEIAKREQALKDKP
jgi:hypothetical protein